MPRKVVVQRGGGWSYGSLPVQRGQVIELRGLLNDKKLLDHGYVMEISEGEVSIRHCPGCGQDFVEDAWDGHRKRSPQCREPINVDAGVKAPAKASQVDLDPDKAAEWPLEEEGSQPVPKMEEEFPGGRRIKMGG